MNPHICELTNIMFQYVLSVKCLYMTLASSQLQTTVYLEWWWTKHHAFVHGNHFLPQPWKIMEPPRLFITSFFCNEPNRNFVLFLLKVLANQWSLCRHVVACSRLLQRGRWRTSSWLSRDERLPVADKEEVDGICRNPPHFARWSPPFPF